MRSKTFIFLGAETEDLSQFMAMYDQQWYRDFYGKYLTALVMVVLFIANLVFYICEILFGDELIIGGALITESVLNNGEWYRLISAMFLHGDIFHLLSNMVGLFFLGGLVEISMGHVEFALIYLISGIGGNIVSVIIDNSYDFFGYSIGASGAVHGLIGAILVLAIREKLKDRAQKKEEARSYNIESLQDENVTLYDDNTTNPAPDENKENRTTSGSFLYRVIFVAIFEIAIGFSEANINNVAHIGGFIIGVLVTCILVLICGKKIKPLNL